MPMYKEIDVPTEYFRGFSQSGAVRVMNVKDRCVFETSCDNVMRSRWYGRSVNGQIYEGHVSRTIEKPGIKVIEEIRESCSIPSGESFDHLCFYVALQAFKGYPNNVDGEEHLWDMIYKFYEHLKGSHAYLLTFPDYSLAASDRAVSVDKNTNTLYFPIHHTACLLFRGPNTPKSIPTATRINWLTFQSAEKYVVLHPKSDSGPKIVNQLTL